MTGKITDARFSAPPATLRSTAISTPNHLRQFITGAGSTQTVTVRWEYFDGWWESFVNFRAEP